ncbi:MAG: large conductance mechanosensitive channel protein MscL [Verrucomicrobiales bacterium]|nr:large conductance mechanosensitive channel protein MscL [Verrucomicrobiales bacterium]
MIKEFKQFAFKGNLVDMAVGIIIGGAFGTVVKSLVDDLMMPVVGLITGGIDFSDRFAVLRKPEDVPDDKTFQTADAAREAGATVLSWGNFLTSLLSFLIMAFVLFLVIKKFIAALKTEEEKPKEEPKLSEDVVLLTEIRDLLKEK